MPDRLVTVDELKSILGIGDLYADSVLEQIADAASDVILSYLTQNRESVIEAGIIACVEPPECGTTVEFRVAQDTQFAVGQTVRFGLTAGTDFSGRSAVITDIRQDDTLIAPPIFGQRQRQQGRIETVIVAEFDKQFNPGISDVRPVIPAAFVYDAASIDFYQDVPEVREAATAIAVDIFQSRQAPGGQIEAVDFTPGPFRMGASLLSRVRGLLGRWVDTGSLVG